MIYHRHYKFVYSFELPNITQSGTYYVATFGEPLLITWIGLEANVVSRIGDSTSIQINVVRGCSPFDSDRQNAFHYCHVPAPVRRQEHHEIHRRTTQYRITYGQEIHVRVHTNFSLELLTRISCHTTVSNVVKVQTPRLVGGTEDHIMWDQDDYEKRKNYKNNNFIYYKTLKKVIEY